MSHREMRPMGAVVDYWDCAAPGRGDASSVAGMVRDYGGFEPDSRRQGPGGGRPGTVDCPYDAAGFETACGLGDGPEDLRTFEAADFDLDPLVDRAGAGRGREPERTVTRRRVDLERAATVYLESRLGGDAPSGEPGDLFRDLHAASPETAERLARGLTSMPTVGDSFLGFRIVEELGRGAFGRVFLAAQGDLAGRLVALKVSAEMPGESQTLAQLQHTNIVPIFSAHHAPPFHAVCMPYFGRATLADLLEDVEGQGSLPASGQAFLKTVGSRRSGSRPGSVGSAAPASRRPGSAWAAPVADVGAVPEVAAEPLSETMRAIGDFSYVDAVLWTASRIADGLAHAHGRGILHRDLKPANVLMTDDGQPMILDFNLSEDVKVEVGASAASVGGTLRYMSPEHLERFLGKDVAVDARGDLFALGVMLFELLTGRPPFEVYPGHSVVVLRRMVEDRRAGAPALRHLNPAITPAVESIVRHCLEPLPGHRYRTAADLHEDLERHLAHLPLKHAKEPSPLERVRKWARRHPRLGSTTTVAVVAAGLLLALAGALAARGQRLAGLEAARDLAEFREAMADVRFHLGHRTEDRSRRARGEELAREALARYGVLDDPRWEARPAVARLGPADRARLGEEVAEGLMLLTQAEALDAAERADDAGRRRIAGVARRHNQLAMAALPAGKEPQAFWAQEAALARLLGQEGEADALKARADKIPLRTARDYYLAAAGLAARGEFDRAVPLAEEATRLEPQHFWSYYILGVSHERLDHHADAMACFTTCTALRPDFGDGWFNRGLAYLRRGDPDRARADFDRAARLRPDWYEPYLNRAIALRDIGDHRSAENDLTRALELGAPAGRAHYLRAAERRASGDRRGAELDQAEGLKREPTDVPGWICRGMNRLEADPEGALADFRAALNLEPKSLEALQYSAYVLSNLPGRDLDSVAMLDRGIAAHPEAAALWSGRGVQLAILGRRDEAHRDAREATWRDTTPAILYQAAAGSTQRPPKLTPRTGSRRSASWAAPSAPASASSCSTRTASSTPSATSRSSRRWSTRPAPRPRSAFAAPPAGEGRPAPANPAHRPGARGERGLKLKQGLMAGPPDRTAPHPADCGRAGTETDA